jgi:hemolysin activation/secretion protein
VCSSDLNIYSEQGIAYGLRAEGAERGVASDYDFAKLSGTVIRYLPLGSTPHQTLHLLADAGFAWDVPDTVRPFALGGSSALRGYDPSFKEGKAFYRLGVEWARPLFKPWLRTVVIAEAGNVYAHPNEIDLADSCASLGLGLRVRVPMFVNLELEAGIAVPLGGGGARFFAGRV